MEDRIVNTVFGAFIIENFGDDYDIATNLNDNNHYYHIPKDLTEQNLQLYFKQLRDFEYKKCEVTDDYITKLLIDALSSYTVTRSRELLLEKVDRIIELIK
jgi:hypothetical protein